VPTEDRGFLMMNIELAPGASMERTFNLAKEVQKRVKGVGGVEDVTIVAGNNIMSGAGSNNALGFILLKPFEERTKNKGQSAEDITKKLLSRSILKDSSKLHNERFFFYKAMIGEEDYLQVWLLDEELTKVPLDSTSESKKFILMINLEDGRIISDLKVVYKYFSEDDLMYNEMKVESISDFSLSMINLKTNEKKMVSY